MAPSQNVLIALVPGVQSGQPKPMTTLATLCCGCRMAARQSWRASRSLGAQIVAPPQMPPLSAWHCGMSHSVQGVGQAHT
jgi:hypothetical protein